MNQAALWGGFSLIVVVLLAVDLGFFHKKSYVISIKEALIWSGIWIAVAMLFNIGIYFFRGHQDALTFLTGYLLEKSLSVDNLFVFVLIFSYFRVPAEHQYKVLFWGIIGAIIMRGIFISLGIVLINRFHMIIYVFGVFLIYTGFKIGFHQIKEIHPERNPVIRLVKRFMKVTPTYEGNRFFIKQGLTWSATPLFVVLLVVETTDVVFAVDSIPAILALTTDPFLVFSSNVFAILGLRALYFALAGLMKLFHYLHYGLAVILAFVGVKMILSVSHPIPIGFALGLILFVIGGSVALSILFPKKSEV